MRLDSLEEGGPRLGVRNGRGPLRQRGAAAAEGPGDAAVAGDEEELGLHEMLET